MIVLNEEGLSEKEKQDILDGDVEIFESEEEFLSLMSIVEKAVEEGLFKVFTQNKNL